MKITEATIWDTITKSAKNKPIYQELEEPFRDSGLEWLAEQTIFKVILAQAFDQPLEDLESDINNDLILHAVRFDDGYIKALFSQAEKDLAAEIVATKVAKLSLDQGAAPAAALLSVHKLLDQPLSAKSPSP